MSALKEAEKLLAHMTEDEKAQLLVHVARDLGRAFPGIEQAADVCGGSARLVRTRIPVWTLVHHRRLGMSDAELLASYPTLHQEDLLNAWTYAGAHADLIDREIQENEIA